MLGDLRNIDIKNVEVLATNQIQQQIKRPFEGVEEHLKRLRGDVKIFGKFCDRFSPNHREGHLSLLRPNCGHITVRRGVFRHASRALLGGVFSRIGHRRIIPSGGLKVADVADAATQNERRGAGQINHTCRL